MGAIYRFVQPRDRFIGAVAGPHSGRLLTEPFRWSGGELTLNIDGGGLGEASVEVRTAEGAALPGFTHADCDRVDLNQLSHLVTWRGRTTRSLPAGSDLRFDVRMRSLCLYSLAIETRANP